MKKSEIADLSKSLDELQGIESGNPDDAETPLVRDIMLARSTPMHSLRPEQIGQLIVQMDGLPFILDLVLPLLEADPLFDGGYYPGDILSSLIRADDVIWLDRPTYRSRLVEIYRRALSRPLEDSDAFLESLGLEGGGLPN